MHVQVGKVEGGWSGGGQGDVCFPLGLDCFTLYLPRGGLTPLEALRLGWVNWSALALFHAWADQFFVSLWMNVYLVVGTQSSSWRTSNQRGTLSPSEVFGSCQPR